MMGTAEPDLRLDRHEGFYVAGHNGLVGSAVVRRLERDGFSNIITASRDELDLRDRDAVFDFLHDARPRTLLLAAARVGGILANSRHPVEFISENLQVQVNVLDAALSAGVHRVLFLGSSCIYPAEAPQPIREEYMLTGHLEPTNDAYAIAKIAGILQIQAVRRQHGLPWISVMPTNLYGPGDNFSETGSHVLPALIRRYDEARRSGADTVVNWGTGAPHREFLHVDDFADACLHILEHYDDAIHLNVGTGTDQTIREIAATVARVVGYEGMTEWDASKPDGMFQKKLDVSRLTATGWKPTLGLEEGLRSTYEWFDHHRDSLRSR